MFGSHFYNESVKNTISVFGSLFNNMEVVKKDGSGNVLNKTKVPLAYGPKQKFLARIAEEGILNESKVALKVPRMSFELVSLTYEPGMQLQKTNKRSVTQTAPGTKSRLYTPSTYRLGIQLNIISKTQDDVLQILEQILPYFKPEYSVTIKEVNGSFKSDIPFVLQSVSLADDYEGDFLSRRAIIYTLDFETRIRFYTGLQAQGVIRQVDINYKDYDSTSSSAPLESHRFTISPTDAEEDEDYTILETFYMSWGDYVKLHFTTSNDTLILGESVIGSISGSSGKISDVNYDEDYIQVDWPDGHFIFGETVTGLTSGATIQVNRIENIWNTL